MRAAALGLWQAYPARSAIQTITRRQAALLAITAFLVLLLAILTPHAAGIAAGYLALAIFAASLGFRLWLFCTAPSRSAALPPLPSEETCPVYTVLIALKDEVATVPQLAAAIAALDYPAAKIDLKLIVEAADRPTRMALRQEIWPPGTELLSVPDGLPRTKPRALNYGLARARGAYIVVYDAEDRPARDQLKHAVAAFRTGGSALACVQAPLTGQGARGWIAGQWALEYAIQFGCLMPALAAKRLPLALGGTSNHFRRSALEAAGGWDAWNVTEDADLGLRLARLGWRVEMIAPATAEAPPEKLTVWINQRSRWLKGYLQTWLVQMRNPRAALAELGWRGFITVQLTLGAALLSALVHGPWALWCLACLCSDRYSMPLAGWSFAGLAYAAGAWMGLAAPGERNTGRIGLALTQPLYWPLQTFAMVRAIYGLISCPHFWAKTPHSSVDAGRSPVVAQAQRSFYVPLSQGGLSDAKPTGHDDNRRRTRAPLQ